MAANPPFFNLLTTFGFDQHARDAVAAEDFTTADDLLTVPTGKFKEDFITHITRQNTKSCMLFVIGLILDQREAKH